MKILKAPDTDPTILNTRVGHALVHQSILDFLQSPTCTLQLEADTFDGLELCEVALKGLRISKGGSSVHLRQSADGWLVLTGPKEFLVRYASFFLFREDHGHHHPEYVDLPGYLDPASMSLIIEVETS